jgi:ABC-type dipeptide/oligopeptide/nickel transport system ATPase component
MENAVPVAGVAGGASSGKSTVCKMIIDQLRDQRVVVVTLVLCSSGFISLLLVLWNMHPTNILV